VLASLAAGATTAELLEDIPTLTDDDVRAVSPWQRHLLRKIFQWPRRTCGEDQAGRDLPYRLVSSVHELGHDAETVMQEGLAGRDNDCRPQWGEPFDGTAGASPRRGADAP
jgi:hypothetical protein